MIEVHHVEPVSLYGIDKPCNKVALDSNLHKELHDVLDIPKRDFSKLHRRERIHNNHKSILSPSDLDIRYDLQRRYFENYYKLNNELKSVHDTKIREIVSFYSEMLLGLTKDPCFVLSIYDGDNNDLGFNKLHEKQIDIHKEINKELISTLSKHYILT